MRYISPKSLNNNLTDNEIIYMPISPNIEENLHRLQQLLAGCSDAVIKNFKFGENPQTRAILLYFDGLADRKEIESSILKSLTLQLDIAALNPNSILANRDIMEAVKNSILSVADLKPVNNLQEVCHHISSGDTILLLDGYSQGLAASTRSWQTRPVQTPDNEVVIFGPKEGFTETLRFNTALLRRRIKSANFKIESFVLGRITKTDVVICYIKNIVPDSLVEEVKQRLNEIDIDAVLDTNYLEEFIMDKKSTIFTQAEHTEKPDHVVGQLLEGKICIMVDGSPMALIMPISFPEYIISPEDYYVHYIPASLFRLLRFTAFLLALTLPSLYVAVITYHHEMVPTQLYLTIASTRQGIPFPAFMEALLLEATFELLREAGLRLPRAVGPAVSIVGALIIGDAAVRAGLVSTPMVVVVAFTGIASFVSPNYNAAIIIRIARFIFLFAAAAFGFLGIMLVMGLLLIRMSSLSSLGLPYMVPMAPLNWAQLSDILIRRPWFKNEKRPYTEGMNDQIRQNSSDSTD